MLAICWCEWQVDQSLCIPCSPLWPAEVHMNHLRTAAFLSCYPPPPSLHCGESGERYALSLGNPISLIMLRQYFYLLFMLLMPHPDTDIISFSFFMWFCHHSGVRKCSLIYLFIFSLEVRQTLSQIPKITFHQKNVLNKSDSKSDS